MARLGFASRRGGFWENPWKTLVSHECRQFRFDPRASSRFRKKYPAGHSVARCSSLVLGIAGWTTCQLEATQHARLAWVYGQVRARWCRTPEGRFYAPSHTADSARGLDCPATSGVVPYRRADWLSQPLPVPARQHTHLYWRHRADGCTGRAGQNTYRHGTSTSCKATQHDGSP